MRTQKIHFLLIMSILIYLGMIAMSCSEDKKGPDSLSVASCEGCHTNYAHLQEVYTPDSVAPAGGCGGEAPHYEPYDRVYMGGDGFAAYKESGHYAIGCVGCHNGTDNTDDKELAHSGNFLRHPSVMADEKCGSCHQDIVSNSATSLHNGTGQKRKVAIRSGYNGSEDFDQLPAHQIEGYNTNCATCHASCGDCHIVRPPIGGGGLSKGHSFTKTPDMVGVCVTCHTSRGGHAYMGMASGTQPDVHLTSLNYTCLDCHNSEELHGDGQPVEQRYAYNKLPACEDCHTGLETNNSYHSMHYNDFNCQVCHSQDYNNCGQCHIPNANSSDKSGPGAQIAAYLGFKIAVNPIPDVKTGFKSDLVLVRRTLAAPENWQEWGVTEYANFDAFPTYNYTSPHNILKWTSRTQVGAGKSCSQNCHIRDEAGVLINKELYLFQDDLLNWEVNATSGITVDGKLPASWFEVK
ncbi:MAG: hypothetical protein K9H64_11965 [Bacteroidales bacterium]|nr:hypothetical protein [Bacteroidales bacterium]MCF8456758.1 hypothetical protein [Bacteroidales bacterium]